MLAPLVTCKNPMQRRQQTLANRSSIGGFGYWSGRDIQVEFRPAEVDTGIVFVRRDLGTSARVPALVQYRVDMPRRTNLRCGEAEVEMVEHVLAALAGMQIDNCEVWVDSAEMPGGDGSCSMIVSALQQAGKVIQDAPRAVHEVNQVIRVGSDDAWVEARPATTSGMALAYDLDYGTDHILGRATFAGTITPEFFVDELAPARTFLMQDEAEWLRSQGLGLRVTTDYVLVFGPEGLIGNRLRFHDECARHKVLDMVGDLALGGCDFSGTFLAYRSGHKLNAELVSQILSHDNAIPEGRMSA